MFLQNIAASFDNLREQEKKRIAALQEMQKQIKIEREKQAKQFMDLGQKCFEISTNILKFNENNLSSILF